MSPRTSSSSGPTKTRSCGASRLRAHEGRGRGDDRSQPEPAPGERRVFPECNTPERIGSTRLRRRRPREAVGKETDLGGVFHRSRDEVRLVVRSGWDRTSSSITPRHPSNCSSISSCSTIHNRCHRRGTGSRPCWMLPAPQWRWSFTVWSPGETVALVIAGSACSCRGAGPAACASSRVA